MFFPFSDSKMINLQKKLQMKKTAVLVNNVTPDSRISVRDKLLVRGWYGAKENSDVYGRCLGAPPVISGHQ